MIEIRPAKPDDFSAVCNRRADKTVKAFTVIRNGEPVAIAGVTIEKDKFVAFSDIKNGVTAPRMTIWRVARKLADHIKELKLPAFAITNSGKFLESLGFEYAGCCDEGDIYRI